jgi:N-acetylmuramoyl-L-alanine amidase
MVFHKLWIGFEHVDELHQPPHTGGFRMKFADLRGRPGLVTAWACLFLLLASTAYYVLGFGAGHPFLPRMGPGAQIQQQLAMADPESNDDTVSLLARVIQGEAGNEPYDGKVAVGAVLLNRMQSSAFPHTLAGVVFQPYAFESVANGLIWASSPSSECIRAAIDALSGWDPAHGALYFWNPSKSVNPWVWTRQILTQIGDQIFAR